MSINTCRVHSPQAYGFYQTFLSNECASVYAPSTGLHTGIRCSLIPLAPVARDLSPNRLWLVILSILYRWWIVRWWWYSKELPESASLHQAPPFIVKSISTLIKDMDVYILNEIWSILGKLMRNEGIIAKMILSTNIKPKKMELALRNVDCRGYFVIC